MSKQLPLNFYQLAETQNFNMNHILNIMSYSSIGLNNTIRNSLIDSPDGETLGDSFQRFLDRIEKKNLGQFYTPKEVVEYMVSYLDIKPTSKILDPTCGCGIFLTTAYNYLKENTNGNPLLNLYGVDLNKTAAELTRLSLWIKDGMSNQKLELLERNIKVGNSIISNKDLDKNALDWRVEFNDVFQDGGFDFIIGNPPYLTLNKDKDFTTDEPFFADVLNGPTNAATLILARSYELLKDGGVMAFVLPKTMLRVKSYSNLRKFILNRCEILHIVDLKSYFPDVRGEQILLFLKKTTDAIKVENKTNILLKFLSNKNKPISQQKNIKISQKLFTKYDNFLILEDAKLYGLIDKININSKPLGSIAEIFRGLSISPTSNIIYKHEEEESEPIIKGANISKLNLKISYYIKLEALNKGIGKIGKIKTKKIVLQNIFSSEAGLISALDNCGYLTFDTVTNIVPKTEEVNIKYLLALMNSKLINFYLIYALFNKSKLTMHADQDYMSKLPIVETDNRLQLRIAEMITSITKTKTKDIVSELDDLIFSLYKITEREKLLINQSLYSIMSPKHFI